MGQIKNIKLHIVTDIKWFCEASWLNTNPHPARLRAHQASSTPTSITSSSSTDSQRPLNISKKRLGRNHACHQPVTTFSTSSVSTCVRRNRRRSMHPLQLNHLLLKRTRRR